jgi:hypothetical protein
MTRRCRGLSALRAAATHPQNASQRLSDSGQKQKYTDDHQSSLRTALPSSLGGAPLAKGPLQVVYTVLSPAEGLCKGCHPFSQTCGLQKAYAK